MAEHDYDGFASISKRRQPMANQATPNVLPLMAGQNGHGCERGGRHDSTLGLDAHSAEQNMANHLAVGFCDQRQQDDSLHSQAVNEVSFVGALKGGFIHFADLV